MNLGFIRLSFILISAIIGSQIVGPEMGLSFWGRFAFGAGAGVILVGIEALVHRIGPVSVRGFSAAVFGLLFGLIMAKLVSDAVDLIPMDPGGAAISRVIITWGFCYLGMVMALRGRDEFNVIIPYVRLSRQDERDEHYVVDTSAIIDGRLIDLCKTGFLEGRLIVPRFVLEELQTVADSTDPIKRSRGRQGLDTLNALKELPRVDVRIHEETLPSIKEVDAKLVKLAQVLDSRIITNDFNLNKVAQFQHVRVLNVNELAQSLRPVVLPGEILEVKPVKEGKERHQSVAYLNDGTMVVIEQGRGLIGQTVRSVVTSVLQTAAGRMVFARPEGSPPNKK